jgi:Ca2+-binding RTX toxin-like protein
LTIADTGASDFTLIGGAGTDKISISVVSNVSTHGQISGFEELITTDVIANGATTTLDMANFANNDFEQVTFAGSLATATSNAVSDIFAITNAKDSLTTLKLNALDESDAGITFARLADGTANALTVKTSAASAAGSFTANNEESLTFDSSAGAFNYTAISATDMTSLTLVGDEQMDLGTLTGTILATVDATGLEDSDGANGDFIFDMSASGVNMTVTGNNSSTHGGNLNITTGSGADTVTGTKNADVIDGGSGNDNISGNAEADTITGGTGDDTLTGGAGADIFNYDAQFGDDTITDFTAGTSGDVLDFQAFGSVTTAVTVGAIALTNNKVTVVDETTANDTATEVDALFTALTDSTALTSTTYTNIYITTSGSVGTVYDVTTVDNSGDNGLAVTVVELGTIDLGSTAWSSLTAANFDM